MTKTSGVTAPLKRRSFFGLAAALAAGLFAGPSWIAGMVRSSAAARPPQKHLSISINPLAVPRTRKGADTNG
jgi:hypothetical protein